MRQRLWGNVDQNIWSKDHCHYVSVSSNVCFHFLLYLLYRVAWSSYGHYAVTYKTFSLINRQCSRHACLFLSKLAIFWTISASVSRGYISNFKQKPIWQFQLRNCNIPDVLRALSKFTQSFNIKVKFALIYGITIHFHLFFLHPLPPIILISSINLPHYLLRWLVELCIIVGKHNSFTWIMRVLHQNSGTWKLISSA